MTAPGEQAGAPALRIHECERADRARQVDLFNACFRKRIDLQGLAWRYDRSPHGPSASFLALDEKGQAVSGYACSPRRGIPFGDERQAAPVGETGDVMTHPEWRKRGIFSSLDRACMQRTAELGWPFVFGLPNQRSAHIFLELGWKQVGSLRTWTAVVRAGPEARRHLSGAGRLRALRLPWDALRLARARKKLRRAGGRFTVRRIDAFPIEVQELSRMVERDFALMFRRDRAWLTWRYLETPSRRHQVLGVYDETGDFRGYAVLQPPAPGECVGYLVDLLVRGDEARAAALAAACEALEASGAALIQASAVEGSWWARVLGEAGFAPAPARQRFAVIAWIHAPEHALARAALDASAWYLTDGDRDDETMG